jgi:hypothetical protein
MSLHESRSEWYCPLYNDNIAAGYCYDINMELLRAFKVSALQQVARELGKQEQEVAAACDSCPNNPVTGGPQTASDAK